MKYHANLTREQCVFLQKDDDIPIQARLDWKTVLSVQDLWILKQTNPHVLICHTNSWCSMIQKIVWKFDMYSTLERRLLHESQHDEPHNNLILTLWSRWRHAHYLFKHALGLGAQWASGSFCTQTWRHSSIHSAPPLCCEIE